MCAQVWDDPHTAEVVQLAIGHMAVWNAEQSMDRVRVADRTLSADEAAARARLGRGRLEKTLTRLLHDFATRWCESRGRGNE